jgi:hypothetical protein
VAPQSIARVALLLAAFAALVVVGPGAQAAERGWAKPVKSRPGMRIPRVIVTIHDEGVSPGFMFLTPRTIFPGRTGPLILDRDGRVVWFHAQSYKRSAADLRPQVYDGKPVLTWSVRPPLVSGDDLYRGGPRSDYHVIADDSYHVIKRIRAVGRGVTTDVHEFLITPRNTALMLGFRDIPRRLSRYRGPRNGHIIDCLVQEVDIRTGRLLFNWSAARHIPLSESTASMPAVGAWDPYHLNSIAEDSDGNLLVSSRHTSTIYEIDRHSGRIIWKLGGRHSSFKMGPGTRFFYQHAAERQPDGTITLLDNRATDVDKSRGHVSRVLTLRLDTQARTATLVGSFLHPSGPTLTTSQGNANVLGNGNVFVGWGISPWFSEYAPDGRVLFAAHFTSNWHHSYRAFKAPWVGHPGGKPAVATAVQGDRLAVYASWNGATEIAEWRVLAGYDKSTLAPLGVSPWQDFETTMSFPAGPRVVQVEALDASGAVLGASDPVTPR